MIKMTKEFYKKYVMKIKTSTQDSEGKWVIREAPFMKAEWKILLFNQDFPNKKIRFEILSEDDRSISIKAIIDGYGMDDIQVHSEWIAQINKFNTTKNWDFENLKFIEKAQTIAIGKALSYLGYGIEYGLSTAEEMEDVLID